MIKQTEDEHEYDSTSETIERSGGETSSSYELSHKKIDREPLHKKYDLKTMESISQRYEKYGAKKCFDRLSSLKGQHSTIKKIITLL